MRPIGQLETEDQARFFADYLFVRELEVQVEASSSGGWTIWVVDEERVDEGKGLLSRFRSMPDAEEFHQASEAAEERRRGERKEAREIKKKLKRPGAFPWVMPGGGWTMVLLVLCGITALLTQVGEQESWTRALQISEYSVRPAHPLHLWTSLVEVRQGQIWRLWTPIFLHFGLLHLIFNLFWLRDFGVILERKTGSWRFICGVAFIALVSNLVQFMVSGPYFGGMSGVVYGLFGYLWIRGRFDSSFSGLLAPMASTLLFVYLALGFFGILGPTANAAHVSGLAAGAAMGWIAAWRKS